MWAVPAASTTTLGWLPEPTVTGGSTGDGAGVVAIGVFVPV
jgi:hypothetical protein